MSQGGDFRFHSSLISYDLLNVLSFMVNFKNDHNNLRLFLLKCERIGVFSPNVENKLALWLALTDWINGWIRNVIDLKKMLLGL